MQRKDRDSYGQGENDHYVQSSSGANRGRNEPRHGQSGSKSRGRSEGPARGEPQDRPSRSFSSTFLQTTTKLGTRIPVLIPIQKKDTSQSESPDMVQLEAEQNILTIKDTNIEVGDNLEDHDEEYDSSGFQKVPEKLSRKDIKMKEIKELIDEKMKEVGEKNWNVVGAFGNNLKKFFEEQDLTDLDNQMKRDKENQYSPYDLITKAKIFKKNGDYLNSSEMIWACFSCATCLYYHGLGIDIESHTGTNILACILSECHRDSGTTEHLEHAIICANKAHKAFYRKGSSGKFYQRN